MGPRRALPPAGALAFADSARVRNLLDRQVVPNEGEGFACERLTRGDVGRQVRDADQLLDFVRPRHLQQNVGAVNADDSGARRASSRAIRP